MIVSLTEVVQVEELTLRSMVGRVPRVYGDHKTTPSDICLYSVHLNTFTVLLSSAQFCWKAVLTDYMCAS